MTKTNIHIRIIRWIFLSVIFPSLIFAQENSETVSQPQDSVSSLVPVSSHSVYTNLGYGNNMILGSSVSQEQPFYFGGLTYGFQNEFFASASAFHLNNFDPSVAFYIISLNYSHVFNSWFDISLGASSYQISGELSDTLFNTFLYGDLTLGFDWRLLYSKLSVSGLFSDLSNPYINLRNSRYFQTPEFFNGKVNVSFDPYVNLLFGTLTKTVASDGTITYGVTTPFHTSGNNSKSSGSGKGSSGSTGTTVTTSNFFGLIEVDLGLPVSLNTKRLTLELEPGYIIPAITDSSIQSPEGFTIMLSLSFKIL